MPILDSDTHLYERRTLWSDYADPGDRDKTLRIADDDLGHAWLMFGDRRIGLAEVHHPGDVNKMGEYRSKVRAGEKAEASYDDRLPRAFWDPAARVADLDRFGIDETVVFPNFGLLWERPIENDLAATKVNMAAWNRWTLDMAAEGKGRLHPVAHLSLRDLDWLDQQLATLEAGGIPPAVIPPAPVAGEPPRHPHPDPAWDPLVRHRVTPALPPRRGPAPAAPRLRAHVHAAACRAPRPLLGHRRMATEALTPADSAPRHGVPAGGRSGFTVVEGRQVHYLEWGTVRAPNVL